MDVYRGIGEKPDMEQICKWIIQRDVNPFTNRKIKIGGKKFNQLYKSCESKINEMSQIEKKLEELLKESDKSDCKDLIMKFQELEKINLDEYDPEGLLLKLYGIEKCFPKTSKIDYSEILTPKQEMMLKAHIQKLIEIMEYYLKSVDLLYYNVCVRQLNFDEKLEDINQPSSFFKKKKLYTPNELLPFIKYEIWEAFVKIGYPINTNPLEEAGIENYGILLNVLYSLTEKYKTLLQPGFDISSINYTKFKNDIALLGKSYFKTKNIIKDINSVCSVIPRFTTALEYKYALKPQSLNIVLIYAQIYESYRACKKLFKNKDSGLSFCATKRNESDQKCPKPNLKRMEYMDVKENFKEIKITKSKRLTKNLGDALLKFKVFIGKIPTFMKILTYDIHPIEQKLVESDLIKKRKLISQDYNFFTQKEESPAIKYTK